MSTAAVDGRPAAGRLREALAGTGTLVRFILRRDRIRLPVWILAIVGTTAASAASFPGVYADAADRAARAALMGNPGVRAFSGPGYGLDDYTYGAMMAQEMLSYVAFFAALMAILLTVRHTRTEEETGRAELVRAGVVARHAHLVAAVVVVGGASLALGAALALALGALGLESMDWSGSLLYGAAAASVGLVFTAVTAVTAQISGYGRGAGGLAGAVFAVAYLLRAAGDAAEPGGNVLSWLSPVGWAQQTRAYVEDRWWPLLLSVALTAVLVALAMWLSVRRDLGAGLRGPRPGRPAASRLLSGAYGLAWRQHRAALLWWAVALAAFGVAYGSLADQIEAFVAELEALQEFVIGDLGDDLIESFLAVVTLMMAVVVGVYALLVALRPRGEETAGRAEPVLAAAVSRIRWLGAHLLVAVVGSGLLLVVTGASLGLGVSTSLGEPELLPRMVGAAVAYAPAVWVLVGLAVALFGLVPRATVGAWLLLVYAGLVGMFGGLLRLPDWMADLSPYGHVPMLPAAAVRWTPLVALTLVAAGLVVVGLVGFRRRDLETK